VDYTDVPETLEGHPFYGLELDDEQKIFRDVIWDSGKDIVFCNSKAGTGKTLIAVGTANLLVQYGLYKKIIYVCSPCNEYRLGYMPGDLTSKAEIYYEPLYSAMQTLGINPFAAIEDGSLVSQKYDSGGYIKPLTDVYLRGCNLDNAVVILEEMQNYDLEIAKKVLTRICKNTKVICIGHTGQNDLQKKERSGFDRYIQHFANKHDDRVAICNLTHSHRSWIAEWADELDNEQLVKSSGVSPDLLKELF
jgi:phosphate starvation-inducible protein PhoH